MSQHDFNIANQGFPATRADLNNALQALASNSSGDAEPSTTFANQWWYETDTNTLKLRNEANNAWLSFATVDQTTGAWTLAHDVDITGTLTSDGLTVAGATSLTGNLTVDGGTIKLDGNYPVGSGNVALGDAALDSLTSGGNNTAIGRDAMTANTSGGTNVALGGRSLEANTTASNNIAVGYGAMLVNTTGANNVGIGYNALGNSTTASSNTAVGYQAGFSSTIGDNNVVIGEGAGYTTTSLAAITAIGYRSFHAGAGPAWGLTAVGHSTAYNNTTGVANVAIGGYDSYNGTLAALYTNTTGSNNVAISAGSLKLNTTGSSNTAIGRESLTSNTTASNNVAVGNLALSANTTGIWNTAIGTGATSANTTGSYNVTIGDQAAIGTIFSLTSQDNRGIFGHNNLTNAYVKVAWTVTSDARDKTNINPIPHGLDFVQQLNPVSYNFKKSREDDTPHGNKRYGFLAQDILALEGDDNVIIDNEQVDHLKYQGESLVPVLVKALQELSAKNDALTARITALEGN